MPAHRGTAARMARFIVRQHCTVFWLSLLCILLLGVSAIMVMREDSKTLRGSSSIMAERTVYDWTVDSDPQRDRDMVESAQDTALPLTTELQNVPERSQPADDDTRLTIAYYARHVSSAWTPAALQQMCQIENVVLGTPGYDRVCRTSTNATLNCTEPTESVVSLFYPGSYNGGGVRDCVLLDSADVAATAATLYSFGNSTDTAVSARFGFYMSRDTFSSEPPVTDATRSTFTFGAPLAGFDSAQDREDEQLDLIDDFVLEVEARLFDHFNMKRTFFRSAYRTAAT